MTFGAAPVVFEICDPAGLLGLLGFRNKIKAGALCVFPVAFILSADAPLSATMLLDVVKLAGFLFFAAFLNEIFCYLIIPLAWAFLVFLFEPDPAMKFHSVLHV